ncbi:MAG TPA: hypothetical protein DEB19_02950 [Synechococcales bacterium UBA8138]|nr:hypothetical protein [Synechococcales bacterium UBA8138]
MEHNIKIIVFDDDPTGSQTVHGCSLLLNFSSSNLAAGLADPSALLFLITNSRALEPEQVRDQLQLICARLKPLLENYQRPWLVVSRGDSTLRGHTPLEQELISAGLGPFHANLLVPAFPQGGRTTEAGSHLLHGKPVHLSAFAADQRFGYQTSVLSEWLATKSAGRINAAQVALLRANQPLADLAVGQWAVIDAHTPEDLDELAKTLRFELIAGGRRHFCQSAASLLNGLAELKPRLLSKADLPPCRGPGLVIVGSHVPLADQQLELLLAEPGCRGVEYPVDQPAATDFEPLLLTKLQSIRSQGLTPVLFSSRGERRGFSPAQQQQLALRMAKLALSLGPPLGFVIAKGGTTSFTLLRAGLGLDRLQLLGQLLPGLSLVQPQPHHPIWGDLPIVTFPGNLGDATSLRQCWQLLEAWRLDS